MWATVFLLILIISLETLAQFFLEKRVKTDNFMYLLSGILAYGTLAYVYYLLLNHGNKLAIANAFWNAGTGLTVTIIGWLLFDQKLSNKQILGLLITTVGITLLN